MPKSPSNRYSQLLEALFFKHYTSELKEFSFDRSELSIVANEIHITLPKNLGDIIYSFRYRTSLPESITQLAPPGSVWMIRPAGIGRYQFVQVKESNIIPSILLAQIKIPDATPGIISQYSLNDEQSLLAKIRYNRLIDLFTGLTCYSLQNHLRTTVTGMGQVETDELYIGLDRRGAHYVLPVQAKSKNDKIGMVQIEQDLSLCSNKFPNLICQPIAAQYINGSTIVLFQFEDTKEGIRIISEKHYLLVRPEELGIEELEIYRNRPF